MRTGWARAVGARRYCHGTESYSGGGRCYGACCVSRKVLMIDQSWWGRWSPESSSIVVVVGPIMFVRPSSFGQPDAVFATLTEGVVTHESACRIGNIAKARRQKQFKRWAVVVP